MIADPAPPTSPPPPPPPVAAIEYIAPLQRAWGRMVDQLFRPFDFGKWLALGFTCWLARLFEGNFSGGFNVPIDGSDWDAGDAEAATGTLATAAPWEGFDFEQLLAPTALLAIGGCVLLFVLVLVPLVMWLKSRGHLMFLDNVVHGRAEVVQPWHEYRREGNSLFLWQLGFLAVALGGLLVVMVPGVMLVFQGYDDGFGAVTVTVLVALAAVMVAFVLATAYVDFFLTSFVVPIMHRERLLTTEAWRVFLPVLRRHWPHFLLVGLFVVALFVGLWFAFLLACILTCCVLWLLMIIPFIGTVVLLPVWVTYRAFTVEFLAQFSPRFDFFPTAAPVPAAPAPAVPPPPEAPPPPPPESPPPI